LLSIFQQGVSADIIQNSAVENFSPKIEQRQKQLQLNADKLVTTQRWKLKNMMSLFCEVFSLPVNFYF
jgi:hypothetical protein